MNQMKLKTYSLLLVTALLTALASCTSSRPSYVLSSGEMEDLLYDIHKAHYLQETMGKDRYEGDMQYALMLSVLKKHDVTQAEWDSSMVYYTRNADEMKEIYSELMDRLEYESAAMGGGSNRDMDSTNIWSGEKHILLTNSNMDCTYQWKQEADTLLKKGEKLKLRFDAVFLNQTSQRRCSAVIALRLSNDSVIVKNQMLSQSAAYTIDIADENSIGIKSISGLFMLHRVEANPFANSDDTQDSQNQIVSISSIALLHEPKVMPKEDSQKTDSLRPAPMSNDAPRPIEDRPKLGEMAIERP